MFFEKYTLSKSSIPNFQNAALLYSVISFTTRAGTPAAIVLAGTSFVTTAPAAITASSPFVTPGKTVTFAPSQTFLPI